MVSFLDRCKRALVTLIRALAVAYTSSVDVSRDVSEAELKKAYRTLSKKVHPDRGSIAVPKINLEHA